MEPSDQLKSIDAESETHAVAPRVTLESLTNRIANKEFARMGEEGILTICLLTMRNGFYIVGQSAPASAENFDAAYGEQLAYDDAIRQAWRYEGYLLRDQLWKATA